MLIISVKINIKDYPSNSLTSGVHISFRTQGSNIDGGSGLIASSGQVTLIRLKKTINEYLNNTTTETFEGKISNIGDYNFVENWGNKNDTVVLALTYQDLSVMIVKELPPYDILTFLSETGGVLGLLLGTSIVNLIVFSIQWAWGLKFNEYNWVNVQNKKEDNELENDFSNKEKNYPFRFLNIFKNKKKNKDDYFDYQSNSKDDKDLNGDLKPQTNLLVNVNEGSKDLGKNFERRFDELEKNKKEERKTNDNYIYEQISII